MYSSDYPAHFFTIIIFSEMKYVPLIVMVLVMIILAVIINEKQSNPLSTQEQLEVHKFILQDILSRLNALESKP